MIQRLLTIFLISICFYSAKTIMRHSKSLIPIPSIEKYYKYVNQANRLIYKNRFLSASIYYDSAFLYKTYPDYVDLKNYILVNSKLGAFKKNEAPIRRLMTDKKIDTALLFADLPKRVFNADNLRLINNLQAKFYRHKPGDNNLQKTLGLLFARYNDALDYEHHGGYSPDSMRISNRRRDSLFQVNLTRFLALYQAEGFPTEEKLGIFYAKGQLWTTMVDLLLRQFIRSEERTQILAILDTQLHLGNIHPARYAALLDYAGENSGQPGKGDRFMQTTVILLQGEAYRPFVYYSDSLMRAVNAQRLAIGLDSFQVTQQQVVCQQFCHYASADSTIIPMAPYAHVDRYPYGFVKASFDKEKQDLSAYKLNTGRILKECKCREKTY